MLSCTTLKLFVNIYCTAGFFSTYIIFFVPENNSLSRIAKGARRATVVATATVVAAIKENGDPTLGSIDEENDQLSSSLNIPSTRNKCCKDNLNLGSGTYSATSNYQKNSKMV